MMMQVGMFVDLVMNLLKVENSFEVDLKMDVLDLIVLIHFYLFSKIAFLKIKFFVGVVDSVLLAMLLVLAVFLPIVDIY
jgi:hypothetical protein